MSRRTFYLWRVKDNSSSDWRTLDSKLTEPDARAWAQFQGLEIERAEAGMPRNAASNVNRLAGNRKAGAAQRH